MSKRIISVVASLAAMLGSAPALSQGQPVTWRYSFNSDGVAQADYPGIVTIQGTEIFPQVGSAADMALVPSEIGTVLRIGFASPGDAPPQLYKASDAACTVNGGDGDGGWQVPTSDGKCWVAVWGESADIRQWGLQPGGQADDALRAAIAMACVNNVPISIPYAGSTPYLLNSSIVVGNGSPTQLSTCNGVAIRGKTGYNEQTSGTVPPRFMLFRYNGTDPDTVPLVAQGPAAQIEFTNLGIDCQGICKTGIRINNIVEGKFTKLGVASNIGTGFEILSVPQNVWPTGMEGTQFNDISVAAPGTGGSGMQVGVTDCGGPCTFAVIGNLFNNIVLNFDGATAGTFGLRLGLVTQTTFNGLRVSCSSGSISGDCSPALGNAFEVVPPPQETSFPADLLFIRPNINGTVNDPGGTYTGTRGINFVGWSTVYGAFPVSTNFALYKGSDNEGFSYPRSRTFTPTDASGAGLSFTVNAARWQQIGSNCNVTLDITFPVTASGAAANIGGLPTPCRPVVPSSGVVGFTDVGSGISGFMDEGGLVTFYNTAGGAASNAALSAKRVAVNFSFSVN